MNKVKKPSNLHERPKLVAIERKSSSASERARLRAATVSQEQREARARREAQQVIAAAEPAQPAPTVREELEATRTRPIDAPMATRIGALPDPLAVLAWETIAEDAAATARQWRGQWKFTVALAVWSAACFVLGTLA